MDKVKWTLTEQGNENESLLPGKQMTVRETESKEKEECMSLHCSNRVLVLHPSSREMCRNEIA